MNLNLQEQVFCPSIIRKGGKNMTAIVSLSPDERFLQFLDPDLCEIKETIKKGEVRTITLNYYFQDYKEDKQLFRIGNKLWLSGDINLTDCLYVINTNVKEDIYDNNCFTIELEEVLVELNTAPFVSHLDFTDHSDVFKTKTLNGALEVKIDWNSLNYWFGGFFNIGVVQDCLNERVQWIPFFGTYNRMNLLRYIEEQTGNVFVTRYEKDEVTNIIHRYLDFINPINISKNWEYHLEYDFKDTTGPIFVDENDHVIEEEKAWEVIRYTNSHIEPESMDEIVKPYDAQTDEALRQYDVRDTSYKWIAEDETVIDEGTIKHYDTVHNINPSNIQFQITNAIGEIINADGTTYMEGDDNPLLWLPADLGFTTNDTHTLITLSQQGNKIGLCTQDRSFLITTKAGAIVPEYVSYGDNDEDRISDITLEINKRTGTLLQNTYFEIYDTVQKKVLFRTFINRSLGEVHDTVIDFGFNVDNIEFDIDESDVYTAVAPVLQLNENSSSKLTKDDFTTLLSNYRSRSIVKGSRIPMIMQKITVTANSLESAKVSLGGYVELSGADESTDPYNYWVRPFKPNDQDGSSYEFWRATAYWDAPFTKKAGSLSVVSEDLQGIDYSILFGRNDTRDDKGTLVYNKTGTTNSSDEDIYSIYNQCALYLKEHLTPNIEVDVEVSNLKNGKYNDYNIHDKVYIKLPDTNELITATVTETTKESNNISANRIKLTNYTVNTLKTITHETIIHASNVNYKYPNFKQLACRLENVEYDEDDPDSIKYPANKLIQFIMYRVKDGSRTFGRVYTKRTDAYGYCSLQLAYYPGEYEFDVTFAGDEEFSETSTTVKVSVGGTVQTQKTNTTASTEQKTTAKTDTTVTKTTYYDKYGRSPDKKKILAIGRISASGDKGNYSEFYGTEFKNYCPHCGKAELYWSIFYAGNETGNWGTFPATGRREGGSAEGHIFCKHCDADYSCQGNEHISGGKKLTVTKARFKSSKSDAYNLKNGKYVYEQVKETNIAKNNTSSKTRKIIGKPSTKVKEKALSIVGDKTGYQAAKAIVAWMDDKIHYKGYGGFCRSPDKVMSTAHGNCCDQTRLLLQLFDAAGLSEYYDMYYVHVHERQGHVYALLKSKKNGNKTYVDPASDSYSAWGYVCQGYSRGSPASKYPNLPFSGCG